MKIINLSAVLIVLAITASALFAQEKLTEPDPAAVYKSACDLLATAILIGMNIPEDQTKKNIKLCNRAGDYCVEMKQFIENRAGPVPGLTCVAGDE